MAAEYLSQQLTQLGHQVTLSQAREATYEGLEKADAVLLASPSWDRDAQQGMPHEDFDFLAAQLKDKKLPQKHMAIMGLGDSSYTFFCGAVTHLEKLVAQLQGTLCVPSLKIDSYYLQEQSAQDQIREWAASIHQTLTKSDR